MSLTPLSSPDVTIHKKKTFGTRVNIPNSRYTFLAVETGGATHGQWAKSHWILHLLMLCSFYNPVGVVLSFIGCGLIVFLVVVH